MRRLTRLKKTGKPKPLRPRGTKPERTEKFRPEIPTRSGISVRSKYERTTANFLTEHNIRFRYEPLIMLDGRKFRPDFFLPDHNLFLEICGYGHMPHYNSRLNDKIALCGKYDLKSIFIHYNGRGSLRQLLEEKLNEASIL